jgi:hypothetical protein
MLFCAQVSAIVLQMLFYGQVNDIVLPMLFYGYGKCSCFSCLILLLLRHKHLDGDTSNFTVIYSS